ncbi:MAG: ribonuclease P protein component 4 [Anaerolineales bacterium]
MRLGRAVLQDLARQRAELLLDYALETASGDLVCAQRQAALARRLCLKYNVRLGYGYRQLFCRRCTRFIVPGLNARVRLRPSPPGVRLTCLECGVTYRKLRPTMKSGPVSKT